MKQLHHHAVVAVLTACLGVSAPHAIALADEGDKPMKDKQAEQGMRGEKPTRDRAQTAQKGQDQQKQGKMQGAGEQHVTGKVKESRQTRVGTARGEDVNRVVLLETEDGKDIAVDLGSDAKLKDVELKRGTPLTASGTVVSVDGEPVFLVRRVQIGEKSMNVKRSAPDEKRKPKVLSFTGTIGQMREMSIKGKEDKHQVAVLEGVKEGKKMLVDLGPKDQLQELQLAKGDKARVEGIAMNIGERRVLVARSVRKGNESVNIEREALPSFSGKAAPGKQQMQRQQPQQEQRQQMQQPQRQQRQPEPEE